MSERIERLESVALSRRTAGECFVQVGLSYGQSCTLRGPSAQGGLIPGRATWTGGFKAVGKTAAQALQVHEHVKQLEAAGAIGADIEVVRARVLFLMSMGAGARGRRAISVRRAAATAWPSPT